MPRSDRVAKLNKKRKGKKNEFSFNGQWHTARWCALHWAKFMALTVAFSVSQWLTVFASQYKIILQHFQFDSFINGNTLLVMSCYELCGARDRLDNFWCLVEAVMAWGPDHMVCFYILYSVIMLWSILRTC